MSLIPEQIKPLLAYVISLEVILTSILVWMYKVVDGIDIIIRYGVSLAGLVIAGLTILKLIDGRKESKLRTKREELEIERLINELKEREND